MPLRTNDVIIPEWGGRDAGKMFRLTEMPALRAEKWAIRMFLTLKGTTAEVPPEIAAMGYIGVVIRGLNSFLQAPVRFEDLEPLLDEMMTCVTRIRDRSHPDVATSLVESDIEEPQVVTWLRGEVLSLHVGFSVIGVLFEWISGATPKPEDTPST